MKRSTWSLVMAAACLYMAYSSGKLLLEEPVAAWEPVQWALLAVTLGLVATGALCLRRAYVAQKQEKAGAAEAEAAAAEEAGAVRQEALAAAEEEAPPPQALPEAPGDELDGLDDLGDLEGLQLLGVETVWEEAPAAQEAESQEAQDA